MARANAAPAILYPYHKPLPVRLMWRTRLRVLTSALQTTHTHPAPPPPRTPPPLSHPLIPLYLGDRTDRHTTHPVVSTPLKVTWTRFGMPSDARIGVYTLIFAGVGVLGTVLLFVKCPSASPSALFMTGKYLPFRTARAHTFHNS